MASLSRPPHRRKHSTTTNASSSFSSLKNPYEDVLLSSGGKTKFQVHEYAEIFSGSSSIPVLDLSRLDQRVGSVNYPSSKLDYSNIFGGLRDDDVAVSYEELFNGGALKKTETRIPADAQSPFQVSGSLHSSGKMKRSTDEASYQSMDGIKQQFNVSFNKTSPRNGDTSNGKTHIAQLHAVPGFTYFVDGTPRLQKTEGDRPVPSMKCEVSRTWSFSAGVDAVTVEGGLSIEKSHIPNKSGNVNEINQKSHISKVPSLPGHTSNPNEKKDLRRSRLPSFASKNSFEKTASEHFSDEELDENSVAAVSAAALKKAIEQAQESIRIAKMIMERKKEGLQVSSKPRSKSHLKVKDNKKTRIGHEIDGLEENNANGRYERLDSTFPTFSGFDIEFAPSPSNSNKFLNAGKAEVGRVREDVEGAKDHVDALPEVGKKFAPSYSPTETVHIAKKVDIGQNIEAAEVHGETTNVTGLVANTECRTAISEFEKVDKKDDFTGSAYKLASHFEMETGKETLEQRELTVHQSKEPEVIAELVENASETPLRVQELEKSVDEVMEKHQAAVDSLKGPEDSGELPERVLSCFQSTQEQHEITHDVSEDLKTSQDSAVTEERENLADDKGKHEEKSVEHEGMGYWEHLKVLKSEFCNLLNESRSLAKKDILEQEDMKKKSRINPVLEENGQHGKTGDEEEEISKRKSKIFPEVGEVGKKVNVVHELEIDDKKLNCGHEGEIADKCMDTSECEAAESMQMETSNFAEVLKSEHDVYEQKLPREYEQGEIADRHMDTSEFEASEGIQMEANNCAEVLKSKVLKDAEETDRGAWRTEEDQNEFKFQETASDVENDEVVDAHSNDSGTIFSDTHSNDTSTVFSEAQEPRDVELNNKAEEHQAAYKGYGENDRLHRVTETFSVIKDNEAGKVFHLNELKMPGTESLHRYASAENLIGSKLNNAFEGLSSDIRTENVGLMDIDHEETLQKDEDIFKTASEIPTAAKINMQNLHEVHTSNNKVEEFDHINLKPVLERNSESNEGSASTFILEHIDEVSAQEAQVCPENVKDSTSNGEEVKDDLGMTSDEREYVTEQSERLSSEDDREDVYSHSNFELTGIDETMETGREEETGQNMEKNKENLSETPTVAQKVSTGNEQHSETNDHQRRIEAIKRVREQAKDRLAVERAIREARERAFAEARERAERAAVERAAAEARQRFTTEAREKLEKASIETKQLGDKASTEAKLRAERAAVERATTEARERALEKAVSQKTSTEARAQGDRYSSERLSSSSRNIGLKHSFSSSDLENFDGTSSESAQRHKARLERHQRIMERAAKALAEKNMRDLLAQREQAERNRLAESLDADIKRWATGKEGNLRALLSTLQYILGSDSGWQPISLTEIITTAAVRKAYRKATLCVHPDKLQQRGASIRQKYICEKVFDLLKAAWNRFNSEER